MKAAHSTIHHRWNKYFFKVENIWKLLDANSRLSERQSNISQLKFCNKFWVCCALCSQALSHRRITPLLRWPGHSTCPQNAYNYSGFHVRPVFQVGHHSKLPQLCSFCAYAPNHITTNTKSYTSTTSEISTSPVYQIRGLVNSLPPSSYMKQYLYVSYYGVFPSITVTFNLTVHWQKQIYLYENSVKVQTRIKISHMISVVDDMLDVNPLGISNCLKT